MPERAFRPIQTDRTAFFEELVRKGYTFYWQAEANLEVAIGRDVERAVRLERAGERVHWTK